MYVLNNLSNYLFYEVIFTLSFFFSSIIILFNLFPENKLWALIPVFLVFGVYVCTKKSGYVFVFLLFCLVAFFSFQLQRNNVFISENIAHSCEDKKCEVVAKVLNRFECRNQYCRVDIKTIMIGEEAYSLQTEVIVMQQSSKFVENNDIISFSAKYNNFYNEGIFENIFSLANGNNGIWRFPQEINIHDKDNGAFGFVSLYVDYLTNNGVAKIGDNFWLIKGILLGDKTFYSINKSSILDLGLAQAFVVSGFNLSVIILLLNNLKGYIHRKFILVIGLCFAFVFVLFLPEINVPAFRAFLMVSILYIVRIFDFEIRSLPLITFAFFILTLLNPFVVFQISLQLTFVSLIAIIYFSANLEKVINKIFPKYFSSAIAVTLSAVFFTSPIIIFYFKNISLTSLLSSIITMSIVEILTILGLFYFIFGGIPIVSDILLQFISGWSDLLIFLMDILSIFSLSISVSRELAWVPLVIILALILIRIRRYGKGID